MQGLGGIRMDHQRAQAIGKLLFSKYDYDKRGAINPNQCYQMFADNCYRTLNLETPPTLEDAQSMMQVLDFNRDKRVSQEDIQNLAVKFLCSPGGYGGMSMSMMGGGNTTTKTTTTTIRQSTMM